MQNLNSYKNGMHPDFALGEHGELLFLNFSEKPKEDKTQKGFFSGGRYERFMEYRTIQFL